MRCGRARVIATAAIAMIPGAGEQTDRMRRPEIIADAAHRDPDARRAHDHRPLLHRRGGARAKRASPISTRYAVKPGTPLLPDLFLD